jgi:DNA-binding PadR family transcriptional regulator
MDPVFSEFGRFADPALLILVSLAGGDKHGYAIMQDLEHVCDVKIGPGTLYGALSRLVARGLIEGLPSEDRRRPYRLSSAGAVALREHLLSMERLATTGLRRLAVK